MALTRKGAAFVDPTSGVVQSTASSITSVSAAPLGYQRCESHLVAPGANTDGQSGAIPADATAAWIYVPSGDVYVAQGEATDVATAVSGSAKGNCPRLPAGGMMWPLDDPTEGDGTLHVRPTTAVDVEICFFLDAD